MWRHGAAVLFADCNRNVLAFPGNVDRYALDVMSSPVIFDDDDYTMKCNRCPVAGEFCQGLHVRRFCELIDPSCPQYDARYRQLIIQETKRARDAGLVVTVRSGGCCGGGDAAMAMGPE